MPDQPEDHHAQQDHVRPFRDRPRQRHAHAEINDEHHRPEHGSGHSEEAHDREIPLRACGRPAAKAAMPNVYNCPLFAPRRL
jgi:hypothetical protein